LLGAESSRIRDINGNIYSTGWNEHGNLAIGSVGEVSDENIFHNMDGLKCEENIEEK
jgi:alpha-tubulin suppressor-like RCC1 family protein